ncbi:MAG: hypothetical protein LBU08_03340, partial [Tannerellaceae bacterium]|nr:hypothetical protein [Tannerellaceae bacterium]
MKTSTLIAAITLSALVPNLTAQEYWDDVYFSSKNRKAVKVVSPKSGSNETVNETDNEIDVDEYNRRYSEPEKSTPDQTTATRQSDTEYTQRILRYHSPEKITIAGADKVELYFSDPSYDTNNAYYSEGYYGSYDPWFYHNPYSLYSWSYPAISYGWYHPWRTHL